MRSSTVTFLLALVVFGLPSAGRAASAYKAPDATPPAAGQGGDAVPAAPADTTAPAVTTAPAITTAPAVTTAPASSTVPATPPATGDTSTVAPDASATAPAATSADTNAATLPDATPAAPAGYKPPSVESTPGGVTIYRGTGTN